MTFPDLDGVNANDVSADCLHDYKHHLRGGARVWKEFVRLFYDVAPIFSRVIAESEHRDQALRLCEGDVYDMSATQTLAQLRKIFSGIRTAAIAHSVNSPNAGLSCGGFRVTFVKRISFKN